MYDLDLNDIGFVDFGQESRGTLAFFAPFGSKSLKSKFVQISFILLGAFVEWFIFSL